MAQNSRSYEELGISKGHKNVSNTMRCLDKKNDNIKAKSPTEWCNSTTEKECEIYMKNLVKNVSEVNMRESYKVLLRTCDLSFD